MAMPDNSVKVNFHLEQDEDDWPPFAVEYVWCTDLGGGVYQVDNVPYFVKGISFGDKIRAVLEEKVLFFSGLIEPSEHTTVHIFCFDSEKLRDLTTWAKDNGCIYELAYDNRYLALDIPGHIAGAVWQQKLAAFETPEEETELCFEFEVASMRHPEL